MRRAPCFPTISPEGGPGQPTIPGLKLLGEPNRLCILSALGLESRTVTQIIKATGLGQPNVSFHLRVLREAGIVRAERRGTFIYYSVADAELPRILNELKVWLEGCLAGGAT